MRVLQFKNSLDARHGLSWEDAVMRKAKLDESFDVCNPDSEYLPAEIIEDPQKESGYMVILSKKD